MTPTNPPGLYEARWYPCYITDEQDRPEEPDWDKVPEERREMVRQRWAEQAAPKPRFFKLWGPQIPFYRNTPGLRVHVVDHAFMPVSVA